jgi:phosphoribosylformylglycinamidine synthase
VHSAHDCSHGGLGVALAELAMGGPYENAGGFGLDVDFSVYAPELDAWELLFSESHARAVITCHPERAAAVLALAGELGVPAHAIGTVGPRHGAFSVRLRDGEIRRPVEGLRKVYFAAIPLRMGD